MRVVLGLSLLYVLVVAVLARKKLYQLHPRRFFLETWAEIDARAHTERALRLGLWTDEHDGPGAYSRDYKPWVAFVMLGFMLILQEYFGDRNTFVQLRDTGIVFGEGAHAVHVLRPQTWMQSARWDEMLPLVWWAITRGGGYVLFPVLAMLVWRVRFRDYGLNMRGFLEHAWIYALFFGIVLVLVVLVSRTRDFSSYYPFYGRAGQTWKDFLVWEAIYAAQFFALEFFFRGFLLFSGEKSLGAGVILAMTVPYCMIHFGKPILETCGAMFAGLVLGTLALKTRSIWSGFLIHVTVAVSMDVAALLQKGGLPGGLRLPASWG